MRKLLRGIANFRRGRRADHVGRFSHLAHGQQPDALLIACSDSRVAPNAFASTEPGDLFVVRNIGNFVPPFADAGARSGHSVPAAIEFATAALRVADVVVCGHSECAAMRAILEGSPLADAPHLRAWLDHGRGALEGLGQPPAGLSPANHLSQRSVLRQVEHLRTYPQVREAEAAGRLRLHAWWYDIARAEVHDYDETERRFVPLDEERVAMRLEERAERGASAARARTVVERVGPAAWERVRAVRLRALADAPDAFGTTLAEDGARPPTSWRERLDDPAGATFLATVDGADVGLVVGRLRADAADVASLHAMWVEPDRRGAGVGAALVDAVVAWARTLGRRRMLLEVADDNAPAVSLYARKGFAPTGAAGQLPPPREHVREHERALEL